jgi:hypothetical protein
MAPSVTWCGAPIWSLSDEKRTSRDHRKSVANDPKRHFGTANYRIAKGLLSHFVR